MIEDKEMGLKIAESPREAMIHKAIEATEKRIKLRIFTLLAQTGIISHIKNGLIIKPLLSPNVLNIIIDDDPAWLSAFLFSNEEIKSLLQKLKH